jgi:hypothetical protein
MYPDLASPRSVHGGMDLEMRNMLSTKTNNNEILKNTSTRVNGLWSSDAQIDWYNNTGTEFTLNTPEQLAGFALLVNQGNTFEGKIVRLGTNIDLSAHYWCPIGGGSNSMNGDVPGGTAFAGVFDGGYIDTDNDNKIVNYQITGMEINWSVGQTTMAGTISSTTSYGGIGLFGKISGAVRNITLSGSITSDARVYALGGVVGYAAGSVYNCQSSVTINVNNEYAARTGGVVGDMVNTDTVRTCWIQYCSNTAALITGARRVGGIVGSVTTTMPGGIVVNNCCNTGKIATTVSDQINIGGIAGFTNGYVEDCYSMCDITLTSSGGTGAGGLVGTMTSTNARLARCYSKVYFEGTVTGCRYAFGLINNNVTPIRDVLWETMTGNYNVGQQIANGSNNWGWWTRCGGVYQAALLGTATPNVATTTGTGTDGYTSSQTTSTLGLLGAEFKIVSGTNSGYPVLAWQVDGLRRGMFSGDGNGTAASPWQIAHEADLDAIEGHMEENEGYNGKYFILTRNLTLSEDWTGLGKVTVSTMQTNSPYISEGTGFAGDLDGGGFTVTVDRTETDVNGVGGLINYLAPSGNLHDITIDGTVTLLYNDKPDCNSTATGLSALGGVVAYNSGTINRVTNKAEVSIGWGADSGMTGESLETCQIYNVGGIAGFNDNCYMTGAIGLIQNSSNQGDVTGYEKVGGIAGENAGVIASCYNSAEIKPTCTRRSGAGGITGRNGNNNTAVETGTI